VSSGVTILIVDDSAMMRAVIKRAVRLTGVEAAIAEASNGREALEIIERQPIDVVFTDINMPIMSGTELLREMSHREWAHIRRVVISTDGSEARRDEVRDLEVSLYINKPFAPEAVRDVLATVCPIPVDAR
jgi:two-component system, chemotaxis family, chemotaxis protein CheY